MKTLEYIGPFWPALAFLLAIVLGVPGVWLVMITWRENRRADKAMNTFKPHRHA
ncbi:hypothetical protein [Spirosoma fluminis]